MRDTIRNTVKEVYNTNVQNIGSVGPSPLSSSLFEKNHSNTTKNVSVGNYDNNTNKLSLNNSNSQMKEGMPPSSSSFNTILFFLLLLVAIAGAVYYYRKEIKKYFDKIFGKDKTISKEVVEIKENGEELKETKTLSEREGEIVEKDKLTIKKGGNVLVDDKVVKKSKKEEEKKENKDQKNGIDKSKYSQNQIVSKDDMYCYIGEDDNMRQCIQVFKDDVCTSGDIFNRIDECLVPRTNK
jgi:hypothetical protein